MEYSSANAPARQMQNEGVPFVNPSPVLPGNPDEINILEYLYVLVKYKKLIAVLTMTGVVVGCIAALIKGPTWIAEALIAPKEIESQKTASLAGLGALGGLMASQLNLTGNASLDKMDLILDSRDFGAKLIENYSFLPVLYRYQWPRQYKKYWDSSQNNWKQAFKPPQILGIGEFLNIKFLKKTKDIKSNTILLKIRSRDSSFTINLATMYVDYLNQYIKANIQIEAKENVAYLDTQLVSIADPLLREKILGLIANEIEKQMVVSKAAFRVVDPVYCYAWYKEIILYPAAFGLGIFIVACIIISAIHALAFNISETNKILLGKIRTEISTQKK
jgi:hypothetical protein